MIHIGIIGGASLTGLELIRQLSEREDIAFDFITSNTFDGQDIADVFPQVSLNNLSFSNQTIEEIKKSPPEVLFLCVDNGKAMKWVESLINTNVKIIDLSADFRFENFETYESVYKIPHSYKHKMVYGLSELYANEIIKAKIVANPGCFATASILSLAPLLNKNIVQQVILDGKSGVSGAGITNKDVNNFNHLSENILAYKISNHRHTQEIQQFFDFPVSFTPHVIPVKRGILVTSHILLSKSADIQEIKSWYQEFYKNSITTTVVDRIPSLTEVQYTNKAVIGGFEIDAHNRLVITTVIDNLGKGASGQAIQNMNLMVGQKQ